MKGSRTLTLCETQRSLVVQKRRQLGVLRSILPFPCLQRPPSQSSRGRAGFRGCQREGGVAKGVNGSVEQAPGMIVCPIGYNSSAGFVLLCTGQLRRVLDTAPQSNSKKDSIHQNLVNIVTYKPDLSTEVTRVIMACQHRRSSDKHGVWTRVLTWSIAVTAGTMAIA